jgi:hypothetical protein
MAQIDPSIPLQAKMPQIENPVNVLGRAQEVSINALKMGELQRGLQEEEQIRNYLAGADLSKPETRAGLTKFGKSGLAYGKALADQERAALETKKITGEINEQTLKAHRERVSDLAFNPSDTNIRAHLEDSVLRKEITPEQANQQLNRFIGMPMEQRKEAFLQMGVNATKRLEQMTISAAQQQTADVTKRGQDISASTQRRGQDIGRIPVGYRMTPEGTIEPIPGGPTTTTLSPKEIQTREAKFPQANLAVKSFESKSDTVLKDIERLRNHPGLSSITGIVAGRAPGVTAAGREALELYEKVVAGLQFKELQDMRNASPTGGALGNVSNQEGTQLRQAAGALSRVQEKGSVQSELERIADSIRGAKSRVREAFDITYEYKPSATGGATPSAAPSTAPTGGKKDDPLGIR